MHNVKALNAIACMQDLEDTEAAAQDDISSAGLPGLLGKSSSSARRGAALSPATSQAVPGWMLDKM